MDMSYFFNEEILMEMMSSVGTGQIVYNLFLTLVGIAGYFLRSIGLYSMAKRRGINNPWLAWIPVAWVWVLGSISDQFRYVTKAQIRSKRKTLLVLNIISFVLVIVMLVVMIVSMVDLMGPLMSTGEWTAEMEDQFMGDALAMLFKVLAVCGLAMIVSIVFSVFYYIALFDLYNSADPGSSVAFLIVGIFLGWLQPFFVFFSRKKDGGMPPRCNVPQEPVGYVEQPSYIPTAPVVEFEETVEAAEPEITTEE